MESSPGAELFGTAGIRGDVRERVTPALALAVGQAAARDADGGTFVVGRDGRETGRALAAAVAAGLAGGGATVERAGQLPTPALAFAARGRRGVMVTASHNPPGDNGLKLFADGEEYDHEAERTIEALVEESPPPAAWGDWGASRDVDPLPAYRDAVTAYAGGHGDDLSGLTIAVDCGNGVAGLATPLVLATPGGDVGALNANVDGHFPARDSKPTPASLADLRAFVREGDADLGIGHDGDGDRVVFVDADGEVVHEDTVVAILAEHFVRESTAADPVVVTTPNASERIDDRVAAAGGRTDRVRLGALHEGIARVRETGGEDAEVVFAAEPWKHIHPDLGPWIDGVASAALFARLVAAQGLDDLRAPVEERPYRKVSVDCSDDRKERAMADLEERLPETFPDATVSTEYGVRLSLGAGWVLVRPSGTEPYIRAYAESEAVDELVERAVEAVEAAVADAG